MVVVVVVSESAVGIEGFMVISVRNQVLCRAFQASGCIFSIFGLKTNKKQKKQD